MFGQESISEDTGQRYNRRAKAAAWTAGIVGIAGVSMETSSAQPAEAAIEHSDSLEAKSPQAMVAEVNSRLIKLQRGIMNEPNVIRYPGFTDLVTKKQYIGYGIAVKNSKNPRNFDGLAITIDKKTNKPTELQYYVNFAKGQNSLPKGSKSRRFSINHRTFDGYNPNVIMLNVFRDAPDPFDTYRIGQKRDAIPGSDYAVPGTVEYLDKPAVVTQQINYVFQQAENILRISK